MKRILSREITISTCNHCSFFKWEEDMNDSNLKGISKCNLKYKKVIGHDDTHPKIPKWCPLPKAKIRKKNIIPTADIIVHEFIKDQFGRLTRLEETGAYSFASYLNRNNYKLTRKEK